MQSKVRTKEGVKDFSFHVKESYLAGLDIFASQASPIFQYICQVRFQQEFRVTRKKNSYEKKTKEGKMKKESWSGDVTIKLNLHYDKLFQTMVETITLKANYKYFGHDKGLLRCYIRRTAWC